MLKHEYERALSDFDEALRLDPEDLVARLWRAGLRASCEDAALRDGTLAVDDARRVCEALDWKDAIAVATLAAAYAEAGEFEKAIHWQTKVIAMAVGEKARSEARGVLKLYENHRVQHDNLDLTPLILRAL